MSILNELASAHNRRDEELNKELARRLCDIQEVYAVQEDIQELVDNLTHKNKSIRSDCIKVLYEIGAIKPERIEMYVDEFVAVLKSKDNRMIWGAMTALGCIVANKPDEIWNHVDMIIETTQNGSIITQDWGVRVLATLCDMNTDYTKHLFPFLIRFLESCQPKDIPRHAEHIIITAKTDQQQAQLRQTLEQHQPNLKPSQLKRLQKILQQL